jgi:hypothetical protein
MTRTPRTTLIAAAIAAGAILVGGGAAIAADGDESASDLSALADRVRDRDAFAAAVADELGTTEAKLEAAITGAATDRIDAAEKAGTLSAADADTLRAAIADDDHLAMRIAQPADVAEKLGVTQAKLDEAYAAVQKANALARVDAAEKAGRITAAVADEMRARIEAADFPGFGAGGPGGGRHGGPGAQGLGPLGGPGGGLWGEGRAGGHGFGPMGAPEGDGETYRGSGSSSSDDGASIAEDDVTVVM